MKPNDFKNATLDAVSFFPRVVFLVKGVSLVCFGCSFNTSISPPTCKRWYLLRENQSAVLVHHANRNAPYNDRKVNDLSLSDILYPSGMLGENSCIVCTHLSLLYVLTVTLHSIRMIFTLMTFIGTSDSCHCRGSNTRFDENLSSEPMLRGFVKFIR